MAATQLTSFDSRGSRISLQSRVGIGGEGTVYRVLGRPGIVAKIYTAPVLPMKFAKLTAIVQSGSIELSKIAAWPIDTLHSAPGGPVIGYLMPLVEHHKAIHLLYGPKSRKVEFPNVDWNFLVHAATNVSRAVSSVHKFGHVIGDVNGNNLLVSEQAIAKFIDCDSFQIRHGDRIFRCEVGVGSHTPPELQSFDLADIDRSPDHDLFGLAVLIFQLLFMGRHPYSGVYLGNEQMPLELAIRQHRFAFGAKAATYKMRPPMNALPFSSLPNGIQSLFERAFSEEAARRRIRPTAQEWVNELTQLGNSLSVCNRNSSHKYPRTSPGCPWCQIETDSKVVLFTISISSPNLSPKLDIAKVWAEISAISLNELLPVELVKGHPIPSPSPWASNVGARRIKGLSIITIGVSLAIATAWLVNGLDLVYMLAVAALAIALNWLSLYTIGPQRSQAKNALDESQKRLQISLAKWNQEASTESFNKLKNDLDKKRVRLDHLAKLRGEKIRLLTADKERAQKTRHLDSHLIRNASIQGLGPARLATLQHYGIVTASDVDYRRIIILPGFGETYTNRLVNWRRKVEMSFRFDPHKGLDPAQLQKIENEFSRETNVLGKEIFDGASTLKEVVRNVQERRIQLTPEMIEVITNHRAALEDYRATRLFGRI